MGFIRGGVLLSLILISIVSEAQPPRGEFIVKGKVVDEPTKSAIEYVNVAIYSQRDSLLVAGTITDSHGNYAIKLNRPGRFYMTADFLGYEKAIVENIELNPENQKYLAENILLDHASYGLNEVTVTSEKPFVSYKIDRKVVDVSKNPSAQGGTAVDALENVPSIEIDIEGEVQVRGSSNFTVLIDGRQSPLTGSDALSQIPASAISTIEIITNPSAKYDPDGSAGIINIVSKKGSLQGHSFVANASIGNSPSSSADLTYYYRGKKFSLTGAGGFRNSEMSYTNRSDEEIFLENNPSEFKYTDIKGARTRNTYFYKAGVDYKLTNANTVSVGGSFNNFLYAREYDSQVENDSGNTSEYEFSTRAYRVNPQSWQINIGDKHIFGENKDHYLSVDYMYQSREKETTDTLSQNATNGNWSPLFVNSGEGVYDPSLVLQGATTIEDANRQRLEINYSLPIADNIAFEAGYTYRNDGYEQHYSRLTDSAQVRTNYYDTADFNRTIHAGWFVVKGTQYGIQYNVGLRAEGTDRKINTEKDSREYSYDSLVWYPTLSLAKEFAGGHMFQASYSKRINRPRDHHMNPFPGLSDGNTQYKPNPALQPEYASSYELNYQKSWGQSFVAVETFFRDTKNEMTRIREKSGDTTIYTIENLDKETNLGAEIAANLKLVKWWTFNPMFAYAYNQQEGEYQGEKTNVSSNNYRVSVNNNFFLPTKTRIQLLTQYRGPRDDIDGTREESYWVSAAVRQDFFDRKLTVNLRVDDIFSTRKHEGYTYSESSTIYSVGERKSPNFVLSLSYKFNQNGDKNGKERGGNGGDDSMDMEF